MKISNEELYNEKLWQFKWTWIKWKKVIKTSMTKMMSWLLLLNVAEVKKQKQRKNRFRKKLMIPESEIPECPEHEVKSKIGSTFVNEKILEKCSVNIYEIDSYFYEHYKEKMQVDKTGSECILFRIDIYFLNIF